VPCSATAEKNSTFKKFLDSMMSYRDDAYLYWQASELPYDLSIVRARRSRG
jgi:TRAP-type mannitol/chloroaromatic compound transport system substrate-binding protein